ncbi:hypothetical protein V5O48_002974 [Marasmius crinis-equi]|uniref:Uncharacterized protein n=1 Tax=Marasmius crinis-equi TaxID=585013 RepID=A0ABR3FUM3_9AGAR
MTTAHNPPVLTQSLRDRITGFIVSCQTGGDTLRIRDVRSLLEKGIIKLEFAGLRMVGFDWELYTRLTESKPKIAVKSKPFTTKVKKEESNSSDESDSNMELSGSITGLQATVEKEGQDTSSTLGSSTVSADRVTAFDVQVNKEEVADPVSGIVPCDTPMPTQPCPAGAVASDSDSPKSESDTPAVKETGTLKRRASDLGGSKDIAKKQRQ